MRDVDVTVACIDVDVACVDGACVDGAKLHLHLHVHASTSTHALQHRQYTHKCTTFFIEQDRQPCLFFGMLRQY